MTVDVGAAPVALTVDDLWRVPAPIVGRAALDAQWTLAAILERVEVAVVLEDDGRLTFFPHDSSDVAAIREACAAARMVHAHLAGVMP
ncbi:hypothetical protein Dvina_45660 [Dactylosporangium vinaceum]|uniref:Uncharacterized protein n=1 Tax=Dactylosporangium vinaceum TaxID=53362 RepID=A0ABV5LYX5_9ACTN|nr:hypothetical protein [Dactylosporangium vinaceum]UAB95251.1 hypothetical protein Dvina_45660 [Dactylosporangium vinaceum]